MLATAKHFAGDGLTTYGTGSNSRTTGDYPIDQGVDQVDRATFDAGSRSRRTSPAVKQHHVGSVMPSYSSVDWTEDGLGNPIKMHANQDLITGWLKGQQGFDGFVISDWHGIDQIDPGALRSRSRSRPASTPGSTCSWSRSATSSSSSHRR